MKKLSQISRLSTWLAILCAIHCALTPIIISVAPVLAGSLAHNHWLEWLLIGGSIGLGAYPLLRDFARSHRNFLPGTLFAGGFVLILAAHYFHLHEWEYALTILGAGLLIAAQVINVRLAAKCACELH